MPQSSPTASTEFVTFSSWVFAVWWAIILAVHIVTCVYNALYAYCYWKLQETYVQLFLTSFQIGMPQAYHHTIAIVHVAMSALHAVCILLMLGGSIWQRSLAFTPWSSSSAGMETNVVLPGRSSPDLLQKAYDKILDRRGFFGVNGDHFHVVLIGREIIETALQTVQAYRMSLLLPRTLLNRFYVILLGINCWSSAVVHTFSQEDEARRRFTCIVLDCVLDLVACMGVELIIVLSYAGEYDQSLQGFSQARWYDDQWVARALNEFKMVVVVSWSDLASRAIFSFGLVITTMNMKELLQRLPRRKDRVMHSVVANSFWGNRRIVVGSRFAAASQPKLNSSSPKANFLKHSDSCRDTNIRIRCGRLLFVGAHVLFGVWGLAVLGLHIQASLQPALSQCFMQVRPWAVARSSCYLAGLDCHALGIYGTKDQVREKWSEFDSSTVVQLLIRHCPALEMPDIFTEFHQLRNIKLYNTTINEWGESAAITNTNHPGMSSLLIARVNMTDGLLPAGLQSIDFPSAVYDIEICSTNLRELPDDLDAKWPADAIIQVEYSQLTTVPLVLTRLQPYYLAVTGNPITELPTEIFEIEGLLYLGISEMNINELPRNVTRLSSTLSWIYIGETNVSFFWAWVDELVERMKDEAPPWLAGASAYCSELDKIENGDSNAFSVPLSPEYAQTLMDSSEANRRVILAAVNCDIAEEGLFYPIAVEDSINSISDPPALVRLN